jgi:hypothetical protein
LTSASTRPELVALEIADPPERWAALGFSVSPDRVIELAGVQLRLGAHGEGIVSWTLRGIAPTQAVDGLPTRVIDQSVDREVVGGHKGGEVVGGHKGGEVVGGQQGDEPEPVAHPNGATALDHVVILTADFDRTADAVAAAGMPLRRLAERNGARQGFRRLGPGIMEIVQASDGPTRFWGLVVIVSDLEALAERLGDLLREIRPAVQPGRRIAPLRSKAGLSPAVAFMDPS